MHCKELSVILFACALTACSGRTEKGNAPVVQTAPVEADTVRLLADRIARCARLATTEYSLHKIVTFDDKVVLSGSLLSHEFRKELPVGDRKIAIPMDVTLRGYIDFAGFSERNISRRGRRITVTLPDPVVAVDASKIDHAGIRKSVGAFRSDFTSADIDAYARQGVDSIVTHIPDLGIIESARRSAADALVPIIREMGYDEADITITFRPSVDDRNILRLTDLTRLKLQ